MQEGIWRMEDGVRKTKTMAMNAVSTVNYLVKMYIFEHYCPTSDK